MTPLATAATSAGDSLSAVPEEDGPSVEAPTRTAAFFGGCVSASAKEEYLAYGIGQRLGQAGFVLKHGGYNGLMEQAARGAVEAGTRAIAVTIRGMEWGAFNPHVTEAVYTDNMGARLDRFLDDADLVVAMGGGVGTLHELTAALWYATNVRPVPVWLVGESAVRLLTFLKRERWLFETPTRPLGFLRAMLYLPIFSAELAILTGQEPTWCQRAAQTAAIGTEGRP